MFEQTTPPSNCCLGSSQELRVDLSACLAWMDQKYFPAFAKNNPLCLS